MQQIVSLPIYPELKFSEIIKITSLIKNFIRIINENNNFRWFWSYRTNH